jgi:hypothetical protein
MHEQDFRPARFEIAPFVLDSGHVAIETFFAKAAPGAMHTSMNSPDRRQNGLNLRRRKM